MDPTAVTPARFRALPTTPEASLRSSDPAAVSFEALLRDEIGGGAPVPIPLATRAAGVPSPISLDPSKSRIPSAPSAKKTEMELRAAFLREMLSPLIESLTSGLSGSGSTAGQDVYEFFVSEALSGPLAEGWPLPSVVGAGSSGANALGLPPSVLASQSGGRLGAETVARERVRQIAEAFASAGASASGGQSGATPPPSSGRATAESAQTAAVTRASNAASGDGATTVHTRRPAATELDELVSKTAREFALPESLLRAVVQVESNGNPRAVSPKGALGLMQLMPGTAREVGVQDPMDPEQNLRGGAAYLSRQIDRFGDLPRALAAYNAGPGAVEKHGGVPPYRETRNYIERVLGLVRSFEDAR